VNDTSADRENDLDNPADVPPLVLEHVSKRFGQVIALDDVSLSVQQGDIGIVIGGSGAGKTTLLKIVIGLERPSDGAVKVQGQDIVGLSERELHRVRAQFGMVFQHAALLDSLSVFDNVALPLREHTKVGAKEIRERVRQKLEALDLGPIEQRLPSEISGGMRKRVGIARALMLEPSILLYDEPTSGLDPITARVVDQLIVKTRDRFGVTSLIISHDMAETQVIADRVYVLDDGRLEQEGTVAELRKPGHGVATRFFESSLIGVQ
jgi:phospholipid/cholesterol/gamma-HCH transport system ATP-binding protein